MHFTCKAQTGLAGNIFEIRKKYTGEAGFLVRKEKVIKKISDAEPGDFKFLLNEVKAISASDVAEKQAQSFVDAIYEYFHGSLVLLRLFATVPYAALSTRDKHLVDKKAYDAGITHSYNARTPVLTLLGTRGQRPEWNERDKSQGFRCIPLVSSEYVASLSMLSMQFRNMDLDFGLFDSWDTEMLAKGRADMFSGMLYVNHAGFGRDEQGRKIVPRQEFVARNGVRTTLGFGGGYPNHPTIVTMFAFTGEVLSESAVRPFAPLLDAYISISKDLVGKGRILSS